MSIKAVYPFAGYDPNFAPGSNPDNPQPEECTEPPQSIADNIDAILYQCDRGNVSLPWLIDALRGLAEQVKSAPPQPVAAEGLTADQQRRLRRILRDATEIGWIDDDESQELRAAISTQESGK